MTTPTTSPDAFERMAARDLEAAALAVRDGRKLTALSLALDAITSLTAQAAEGRGTFIPFGDEVSLRPELWSESRARELHALADRMLNQLPTTWASVKRFRELVRQSLAQRLAAEETAAGDREAEAHERRLKAKSPCPRCGVVHHPGYSCPTGAK